MGEEKGDFGFTLPTKNNSVLVKQFFLQNSMLLIHIKQKKKLKYTPRYFENCIVKTKPRKLLDYDRNVKHNYCNNNIKRWLFPVLRRSSFEDVKKFHGEVEDAAVRLEELLLHKKKKLMQAARVHALETETHEVYMTEYFLFFSWGGVSSPETWVNFGSLRDSKTMTRKKIPLAAILKRNYIRIHTYIFV